MEYDFMKYAFISGTLVSAVCGIVSVFVVLRKNIFASHGFGHISLAGSSGAMLLGCPVIYGQLFANLLASVFMGYLDEKMDKHDLSIGVVLTFFLGLGSCFLFLYQSHYLGTITGILFGNILTTSRSQINAFIVIALIIISVFSFIARPLFFHSIDPTVAESQQVSSKFLSIIFFVILSLTVTIACQIVGVMLMFALLVGPGAISLQYSDGFYASIFLSIFIAVIITWLSLFCSFCIDLPMCFCVTMMMCFLYCVKFLKNFIFSKLRLLF